MYSTFTSITYIIFMIHSRQVCLNPSFKKLLDAAIVKNIYNIVTEDNGDNKELPIAIQCSLCTVGRWSYGKNNHKPSKVMTVTHFKRHHNDDWNHYCILYPMLNEKILPIISPSNTSSTSTSSNVSPSSSPLVRRTSSKRSLSASDSLSQKCIQDVDITDTIRLDNAMKTVISAFAVFNISFK
jgi:hypothetical protein